MCEVLGLRWVMTLLKIETTVEECRDLSRIHTHYTEETSLDILITITDLSIGIMVSEIKDFPLLGEIRCFVISSSEHCPF